MRNSLIYYFLIFFLISSCSGNKSSDVEDVKNDSISITHREKVSTETTKIIEEKKIVPIKVKSSTKLKTVSSVGDNESEDGRPTPKVRVYSEVDIDPPPIIKTKVISVKRSIVKKDTIDVDIKIGTLVYHVPDTMVSKKTYIIKVRINRDTSDNKIIENIDPNIKQSIIKTTPKMEVVIIDPSPDNNKSFIIVKSNDDAQLVDNDEYTEWVYGITPLKNGKLKLNIVVSIIRDGNKKQVVYSDNVYVKSNPTANIVTFIGENWKWIISTIIIPLVIWWWNRKRKK